MKRLFTVLFVGLMVLMASEECHAQFSKMSFGKYGISSIRPESFRSVKGSVWVEINNSMQGFTVSEIRGLVYNNGMEFVSGRADDVYVPAGSSKVTVTGRASLCPDASLLDVLALIAFDPQEYSVDLSVRITLDSGETRVVSKKNLPVTALLKLI